MLYNFRFIECYKDLQHYVHSNYFDNSDENRHLGMVNNILHEKHKLDTHQYNTDLIEHVRDQLEQQLLELSHKKQSE